MANRPRRHRPEVPPVIHDNDKWSIIEKRRIQRALLKYSPLEIERIAKAVQSKNAREVKAYLELMEKKVKKKVEDRPKEAAELWGTLATDLISCELKDYSEALSEVMAIAGNLENRDPPASPNDPDYSSIYRYISAILAGNDLPYLGKIECSIVQDLLHGLIDTIRTSDTSKQQEIMLRKYHLFTSKIDVNDTMRHVNRCRKAVNNDFSDFEKPQNRSNQPGPSATITTATAESTPVNKRKRGRPVKKGPSTSITVPVKILKTSEDIHCSDKQPEDQSSTSTGTSQDKELNTSMGTGKNISKTPGKRGRPRKDSGHQPGPAGDSSSTDNSQGKHLEMQKSKESDQIVTEKLEKNGKRGQSTEDSTSQPGPSGECSKEKSPSPSQNQPGLAGNKPTSSENQQDKTLTNQDEIDGIQKEDIPKKPSLFTLNPFCIPIDLIKFNPLVSSTVVFKPVKRNVTQLQGITNFTPKTPKCETQQKDGEVEVICVDEKKDIIGREKFISIVRTDINDDGI